MLIQPKDNSDLLLTVNGVAGATVLGDENRDLLATVNASDANYTTIEFDVLYRYTVLKSLVVRSNRYCLP